MFGTMVIGREDDARAATMLRSLALLALAAFVFVAVRPNTGVRHDGILYAAQALYRMQPEIFGGDVFFKYGSQESFTVFGRLYAPIIQLLGFGTATLVLLALAQVLFFVAAVRWTRAVLPPSLAYFGLLAICLSSGGYGGKMIFHYAEPFVTARPFAEVLALFALPMLVAGRRWPALALLVAAAALHPLMALPGLAVWWAMQVAQDRRWTWLGLAGVAAVVVLALAGVAPFSDLLRQQDPQWRAAIEDHISQVYVSLWTVYDYMMLATDVVLLAWAWRGSEGMLRRLLACLLAVGAGFFAISFVGADLLSDVLVSSLQLWRVQWLMHFVAMSVLPLVLLPLLRGSNVRMLCGVLLLYATLNRGLPTGGLALLGALVLASASARRDIVIERKLVLVVGVALALGMAVMWNNNVLWDMRLAAVGASQSPDLSTILLEYLRKPSVGPILVLVAALAGMRRWPGTGSMVASIAVAAALVTVTWDQRSTWTRVIESYAEGNHPFTRHIAPQDEVYWSNEALAPWMMLHRRTYVSIPQVAGLSFNRENSEQIKLRSRVIALFDFQAEVCGMFNALKNKDQAACEPDIMTIRTACETDARLSFVVSQFRMDGAWIDQWQAELDGRRFPKYFLYSCKQLLATPAPAPAPAAAAPRSTP